MTTPHVTQSLPRAAREGIFRHSAAHFLAALVAFIVAVSVFGPLQVLLPAASGEAEPAPLDGKVIAISEDDGPRTALVRFTGIDWDTRDRVEAYARRARGLAAAEPAGLSTRPSAEPGDGQATGLF